MKHTKAILFALSVAVAMSCSFTFEAHAATKSARKALLYSQQANGLVVLWDGNEGRCDSDHAFVTRKRPGDSGVIMGCALSNKKRDGMVVEWQDGSSQEIMYADMEEAPE